MEKFKLSSGKTLEVRLLKQEDSLKELTVLLNRAYQFLQDMGLNYLAAAQDETMTQKRVSKAYRCYVGLIDGQIISTISLYDHQPNDKSQWYNQEFVSKVGQFAVLPEYQKCGIGGMMMDIVEREAMSMTHIDEVALDTAETAHHLIALYKKRGYRYVETISWDMVNYNSVILSKNLRESS